MSEKSINEVKKHRRKEVKELLEKLEKLGMKPEEIAAEAFISSRSIYRWRKDEFSPFPAQVAALRNLLTKKLVVKKRAASHG